MSGAPEMAMNIDSLIRIKADVQGENNIRRLGNSMQGVQGKVKNLKMSVQGLTGAMRVFGTVLAAGAFTQFLRGAINLSDEMGKASVRTGVAADKLLALKNAGMLADVTQKDLINSLTKLNVNLVAAAEGNEELAKRFQQLGVSIKGADGELRDTDEVLKDIADRFADMPDGAQKAAAAVTIFGRSGAQLITLLNGGSASLDEFNYKLSDDFAPRAELFNDTITKTGFQFEGFRLQLMDALLPALQVIAESFGDLFASENDWKDLFKVIENGIRGVAIVIMSLVKLVDEMVRAVVAGVRITKRFLKGDIKGMEQARSEYFQGVGQRFGENVKTFERLAYGSAEAPTQRKRTSMFDLRDLRQERASSAASDKTAKQQEAAARRAAQEALKLAEAQRKGFEASLLQLDASKAALAIALESNPVKRVELEYEERKRVLMVEFAQAAQDSLTTAQDLNIERRLAIDLDTLAVEKQKALAEAAKESGKSFKESFGEKMDEYKKSLADFGGQAAGVVINAFQGMEDALTDFVTTGKADFRALANSIIADITRIAIRQAIIKPLVGALFPTANANGNVFAANGIVPFAKGGIVDRPMLFPFAKGIGLMGEAGPEAIMPLRRGPGGRLGVEASGGVGDVIVNVDASGTKAQGDQPNAAALGRAIGAAVQAELIKQKRPGGLLA